jgi:hypothetical protein
MHLTSRSLGRLWLILTLAAATAAVADDPVTLTRGLKKGTVLQYKATVKGSIMGAEFTLTSNSKQEVQDVSPTGEGTIVLTESDTKLSVMGMEMNPPAPPPVTVTRDKYGKISGLKGADAGILSPEMQSLLAMLDEIVVGEKPVKAGEAWESVFNNPAVKDQKFTVKGTYIGTEKLGDKTLWKVKQTGEAAVDAAGKKMTVEATGWIDPADGTLVRQESTVTDLPTQFGPMSWKSEVELVSAK